MQLNNRQPEAIHEKSRTIVYIDGYNWYHAIFKHYPEWKWLNIQKLFETLRPHEDVHSVKFFTSIVDEGKPASPARDRQERYIAALRTLPKVTVILGKFQNREVTCRAACRLKYQVPEEKKTDVNIAVEILSDAFKDKCDTLILVSGDSDIQPPIEYVRTNYPTKRVTVYIPALAQEREKRRLDYYKQIGVDCKFFPTDASLLLAHQLKHVVSLGNGNVVCRPEEWCKNQNLMG